MIRYLYNMDETDLKEQQREYDFTSILNHPENYSEEELREFFSRPENKTDYRLYRLAQMTANREYTASPDVDRAWNMFKRNTISSVKSSEKKTRWHVWGAALAGAAAVCVGLLIYHYAFLTSILREPSLVAMEYDERPQVVVLESEGEQLHSFVRKDSISFFSPSETDKAPVIDKKVKMRTLSTPRGVDFKVTLPDGTDVWLNAESSLQFPTAFTKDSRKVILTGEAYFKVAHNKECPFVVETDKMKVRVLGTEFNFRNYASEKTQVSLIDGSISILPSSNSDSDIILKPGQGACVEEDGHIRVLQEVDTYGITQWVNGYFYFQNQPLIEILQDLARWYNVGVVFENSACANDKMHFSALRSASLAQAVDNLNCLQKVRIALEDNKLIVR